MRNLLIVSVFLSLGACNTVAGMGEDISAGAHKVGGWMGMSSPSSQGQYQSQYQSQDPSAGYQGQTYQGQTYQSQTAPDPSYSGSAIQTTPMN